MIINTKTKMYRNLKTGKLGNALKIYNDISNAPNTKRLAVRFMEIASMNRCIPQIYKRDLLASDIDLSKAVICDCPKDLGNCMLNAEVARTHEGINLRYKVGNMVMRQAMNNPERAIGLKAKIILEYYTDPASYDTIMELLDMYPDHVIEFSVFDKAIGIFNRPTIIWEVRKY